MTTAGTMQNAALYGDVHFEWSTFFGQLVGFVLIVWVLWKYIMPPVRAMMARQQDTVRRTIAESEQAAARLARAESAHGKAVADAQVEASKIRADAGVDAEQIAEQLRAQSESEVARVDQHGRDQVVLARQQLIRRLKADLGATALAQADRQVRDHLGSTQAKSDSVDRFLDELEAMSATGGSRVGREF